MGKTTYSIAYAGLLGIALLASAGCMHRHVSHCTTGEHVNPSAFDRIVEGKTPAAWVQSAMGKPTSTKAIDDSSEIWTWTGSDRKTVDAQFLVVSDHSTVTEHTTACIEVKNGVVIRKWIDEYTVKNEENIN